LKLIFLGTGTSQGIPVVACSCEVCSSTNIFDKRLRSSVYIEDNNKSFIIDTGPDFRQQLLVNNIKKLDYILFTHEHRDHISGLDDIRSFNWLNNKPMDIYAEERVINMIKSEYYYAFKDEKYPGIPEINPIVIKNNPFIVNDLNIIPIRGYHHKLPVLGFRLNNLTYITDMNYIEDVELNKIKGTKILIINALRKEKHISHFNLEEAINIINIVKPETAYLTHISHLMGFHNNLLANLPHNIKPAYDNLSIEI